MKNALALTVLYDNNEHDPTLQTGWGFSCLIEGREKTILFDTGRNGMRLLFNMKKLDIDPSEVEVVVLSHAHRDHVGGLSSFLTENPNAVVYMLRSFPKRYKDEVKRYGERLLNVESPLEICPDVYSTGELTGRIKEQSLLINTEAGTLVITGCAHPGIVKVIQIAKDIFNSSISLVLGGFHLKDMKEWEIRGIIEELTKRGVERIGPCHCSGSLSRELFKRSYGKGFLRVGVGTTVGITRS